MVYPTILDFFSKEKQLDQLFMKKCVCVCVCVCVRALLLIDFFNF
jgi:hypothetical protein